MFNNCDRANLSKTLYIILFIMIVVQVFTKQKCGTVYDNKCKSIPEDSCTTIYKNKCRYDKKCSTSYVKECTKVGYSKEDINLILG